MASTTNCRKHCWDKLNIPGVDINLDTLCIGIACIYGSVGRRIIGGSLSRHYATFWGPHPTIQTIGYKEWEIMRWFAERTGGKYYGVSIPP